MTQTKAQLIGNIVGNVTISGVTTSTGGFVGNLTGTATTAAAAITATVAQGLTGSPNLNVGIVTGTAYYGDGSQLTGVSGFNILDSFLFS